MAVTRIGPGCKALVAALALAAIAFGDVRAQVLPFTYYTPDREINPLPSAEVHRVHQDRTGMIWIAVYSSGLARYDGATLELYDTDDGLRDLYLWDIVEDARGHLWIASNAGIVVSEQPVQDLPAGGRMRFLKSIGGTDLLGIAIRMNNLAATDDGSVWVGTDADGLVRYRWDGGGEAAVDTLTFRGRPGVHAIAAGPEGRLFVALSEQRLVALDHNGSIVAEWRAEQGAPSSAINVLYHDAAGRMYAGTADGAVYRIRFGDVWTAERVVEPLGSNVGSILRDAAGTLWVGTQGSGLARQGAGTGRVLTRENGLISESIHHVLEDHEGNLWISQTGGLVRLRPNYAAFSNYTSRSYRGERPALPAAAVNAVLAGEGPCTVWAATAEAGVACIESSGTSRYVQEGEGLENDWVNALGPDGAGGVWAGTLRGISRITPAADGHMAVERIGGASILAIRHLDHPSSVSGDGAAVRIDWFPAFQTLYARLDDDWYIFREASGLPGAIYQSVEIAADGHLLVGTRDRGLFRSSAPLSADFLRARTLEQAPLSRSRAGARGLEVGDVIFEPFEVSVLPSSQIDDMQRVDGDVWIATPAGIAVLSGASTIRHHFDRNSGLPADNVISIAFDAESRTVWAGTNRGLVAIDVDALQVRRVVTQQDGLVNNEGWFLGSVSLDGRGGVLYGTASGLTWYRPAYDVLETPPPRVLIRRFALASGSGRSNEVAFEYAALTFADEKRTLYRTRLVGYEQEWSASTTDTRLRYTNLPAFFRPRTYTLEVVAVGAGGAWSEQPASLSFDIAPPWWLTWWAFAIYVMVLGLAAIGVHGFQHSRVVRRERERARLREAELRAETAQAHIDAAEARSRALMADNERRAVELQKARELERAYYDLKAAQTRLVQAEKMASLGRLAAGIAHEIKNPLNFVNNFAALSGELVEELREVLDGANGKPVSDLREDVDLILADLELNTSKIREHGKRTDGIVRSMLMHSRGTGSEATRLPVNEFVDEYLNLAYHGMRAEHPDFNTAIVRNFAPENPDVPMAPQEIGRVLINLLNNAFYAVHEKRRVTPGFQPEVAVVTQLLDTDVEIRVRDNGPGIPAHIRERIFEPFFTTKPTGEGTGLGLSLSYDIVTQGHGGRLTVDSRQGDFTEFTITLPLASISTTPQNTDAAPVSGTEPTTT